MIDSSRRNDSRTPAATPRAAGTPSDGSATQFPLVERFPALGGVPRLALGTYPTPVVPVTLPGAHAALWIKRDACNAIGLGDSACAGGNKLRALEFLLAPVHSGDTVIAVGGEGSTHVLATVALAHRCGARTLAIRWPHDMNPVARRVAAHAAALADEVRTTRTALGALLAAGRAARAPHAHGLPAGGTSALGMLGAVNAALELAAQIAAGALPPPARIVLPLGTGGTAAGLALGLTIADIPAPVVAVRVTPRLVANRLRLHWLARRCARLIEQTAGVRLPHTGVERVTIAHGWYGGAYGRPLPAAQPARAALEAASGLMVDDTYGAKAFAAAAALVADPRVEGPTLFWQTFDPGDIDRDPGTAAAPT